MIAQIRAELLKIRSTRTTVGLILGMVALILLFTLLTGLLSHPSALASKEDQRELLSLGSLAGVFSALAGMLLVTSEYRFGTIRPTFLFNPDALTRPHRQGRRRRVGRNRVRGPRRGDRLGDRLRDPRRPWHHDRAEQRRHSAPHPWRTRRRRPCGARSAPASERSSTTKSAPSSPCSPGGSSSTTSCSASCLRWGASCRPVPRTHSWASESTISSRQASAPSFDRLGRRARRPRYRPVRSAGHQLTPWVTGMGSWLRPASDQGPRQRRTRPMTPVPAESLAPALLLLGMPNRYGDRQWRRVSRDLNVEATISSSAAPGRQRTCTVTSRLVVFVA